MLFVMDRKKNAKEALELTPLELVDIIYEEAARIAKSDKEAESLTNDAIEEFLENYEAPYKGFAIKGNKAGNC